MSDLQGGHKVRDLAPEEVARGVQEGRVVLVDVREPNETSAERFPGAVLVPLSSFDPATIPDEVLRSERARRNAARRVNPSGGKNGGRPVTCTCGDCSKCKGRAKRRARSSKAGEQKQPDELR